MVELRCNILRPRLGFVSHSLTIEHIFVRSFFVEGRDVELLALSKVLPLLMALVGFILIMDFLLSLPDEVWD